MNRRRAILTFIATTLTLAPVMVSGQEPIPVTDPFRVNTLTTGYQNMPSVSLDAEGNFVVVWQTFVSSEPGAVHGQRYDRDGNALGAELRLNAEAPTAGSRASVAHTVEGGFVVVWRGANPQDTTDQGLFVRRFDGEGEALEGDLRVTEEQDPSSPGTLQIGGYLPSIAATADGGFIVVWDETFIEPGQGFRMSTKARRYDKDLGLLPEFQVDEDTLSSGAANWLPAITSYEGGFVICWQKYLFPTGQSQVYARLYDPHATPLTPEIPVSLPMEGDTPLFPNVAALPNGSVIVWHDPVRLNIGGQRVDSQGVLVGEELVIGPSHENSIPALSSDPQGNFVVAWNHIQDLDPDADWHVLGRRFARDGTPGEPFRVSLPGEPGYPASVATARDGDFVVTWTGGTQADSDIFARRYQVEQQTGLVVWPNPVQVSKLWGHSFPGITGFFILGREALDAAQIRPRTVRFGPRGPAPFWSLRYDVNRDGLTDLGLVFFTYATGIQCGDHDAPISGEMLDGSSFEQPIPIEFACNAQ